MGSDENQREAEKQSPATTPPQHRNVQDVDPRDTPDDPKSLCGEELLRENRQLVGDLPVLNLLAEFRAPADDDAPRGEVQPEQIRGSAEAERARTYTKDTRVEDAGQATLPDNGNIEHFDLYARRSSTSVPSPADNGWGDTNWVEHGIPRQLGRFALQRKIGEGGFGVVFLATDKTLGREVALKLPRVTSLASREGRERFLREVRVAGSLDHRHIAPVYEAGTIESTCYMASPYYRGGSLADVLHHQTPIDIRTAVEVVTVLADALQFAHMRGILHRDLKPANVLLDGDAPQQTPLAEQVRLSDFGLARVLWEESEQTQVGALLGTPSYMSPEQAESRLAEISTASDIYALGAILYELLTGVPPFRGENPLAVMEAVRTREPVAPRQLREQVPVDLEAICLKCLEKKPERRYASAAALNDDLQRFLSGTPVHARPVTAATRLTKAALRNPAMTSLSLVALLALVGGTITSTILWRSAANNASRAELRSEQLSTAVSHLNAAVEMLLVTVAESDELRGSDAEPLRRKLLDQAQKYYQLIAAQQPLEIAPMANRAETMFLLGLVHKQLGDMEQAFEIVSEAIEISNQLPKSVARQIQLAEWQRHLGEVLDKLGRPAEAIENRRVAVARLDRIINPDAAEARSVMQTRAMIWSDAASGHLMESQLPAAIEAADRSQKLWQQLEHDDGEELSEHVLLGYATSYWVMGTALEETNQLAAAEEQHRRARQILIDHHVDLTQMDLYLLLGRVTKKLGISVAKQDRLDEARELYVEAIDYFTELVTRHPRTPEYAMELCSSRYSLSVTEYLDGFPQRAVELVRLNTESYETLAAQHSDRAFEYLNRAGVSWNMLGSIQLEQEQFQPARDALEEALRCYRAAAELRPGWTFNQIVTAESEVGLARIAYRDEDVEAAFAQAIAARLRLESIVAEQPENQRALIAYVDALDRLAEWSLEVGDLDAAAEANQEILQFEDGPKRRQAEQRSRKIAP